MDARSQDINNHGFQEIKPPPPSGYRDSTKMGQDITMPKTSLDASKFHH